MAAASELVTEVLHRVRDPGGQATTRAQVLDLLDRCQIALVRHTGTLIEDRTGVTIDLTQHVFPIDTTTVLRIVDIYNTSDNKRLSRMRWSQLVQVDTKWWRTSAVTGPTSWAPLGTNYYILYPAASIVSLNYTFREQVFPTTLTAESVDLDIPTEHHHKLVDLVEALLLLRNREDTLVPALDLLEGVYGKN